jgi:GT2 family glycosyltransferase
VAQCFDPARFEIIIVDDRPSGSTRDIVERWQDRLAARGGPTLVYLRSYGPHGPAAARNLGWRAARGEIVAFTDDDTVADPDWLVNGVAAFTEDVDVVRGRIVMPLDGVPTDYERDAQRLETAEFVTANCLCRKRVLEAVGGFDQRFRLAWREDSDLHFRLLDYGAEIITAPDAVVVHPVRPASWGVSLWQAKKIQFDALLYKKHPQRYRERIRAAPRWDYYLIVAGLLGCLLALFTGHHAVAAAAGLLWLCMTAYFCVQRLRHTSHSPSHVLEMIVTSVLIPPVAVFWRAVGAWRYRAVFL